MTQYIGEKERDAAQRILDGYAGHVGDPKVDQIIAQLVMEVRSLQARLDQLEGKE